MKYQDFLKTKLSISQASGFKPNKINDKLFDFQKLIVTRALEQGKFAIFADCGMGKSIMQLEWAYQVHQHTQSPVLILAPLAVSKQTKSEGAKFGYQVNIVEDQDQIVNGINITNYEKLHKFNAEAFSGIVLDESSILKNFAGRVRNQIIDSFQMTPYKLACTATPSPNDYMEIGNHAQFLNICSLTEMLSMFFINDATNTGDWRLKRHAESKFWQFMGSWAVMIQKPSDMGYEDKGFNLPALKINQVMVNSEAGQGRLIADTAKTLNERREARRDSLQDRVQKTLEIINQNPDDQFLIWCDFNNESEALKNAIPGSVEVKGSDTEQHKERSMLGFAAGEVKYLITKASIAGFGMNWQNCNQMIFCGLSDSYEQFYQAIRRCWRYGQKKEVNAYIVISEREAEVLKNIERKQQDHLRMFSNMVKNCKQTKLEAYQMQYKEDKFVNDKFTAILGDSCIKIKDIETASIDYSIFSPPFASLYTYSNSEHDLGNCKDEQEFFEHFKFMIPELFRIIKPGRLLSFHCMNLPTSKFRDGYIGLSDFRGELIRAFQNEGWIYHSEVCIWKDPVVAMQRTKALGLLHKQIKKDSSMCRQGIPDYLVTMRKPGENLEPITHTADQFPVDTWQKYASPIWTDINQSDTLQKESAREAEDEKHICPLQLEVIKRALYLWSNPNDLVFSPFMGIGSEGYMSLKTGRRFIGIELKESYYNQAVANLSSIADSSQMSLFPGLQLA